MGEANEINSNDPKREKVRVIPLSAIDDAPDHPFGVRDEEEMAERMESISTFGVIHPVIVRRTDNERYEMISGHRRKYACLKLGTETLPVIVRDLSREEAIIIYGRLQSAKSNAIMVRAKTALENKKGEGYVDTGVKIIIAVVVGAVILGGLYALFDNVILPRLNTEIQEMFNYTA